ncbi:MAG TPA: DUF5781 family protein [Nitrososphaerales archaeon]|nr:DUF5781 family protein [Nitrososphaerales archaeon]
MHSPRTDRSLEDTLDWAKQRMGEKGYVVSSKVTLEVEPNLAIMGYAKKEGEVHKIMISDWALDSEMLRGLVLHELAHVYFTERGACSHDSAALEEVLDELRVRDGIRVKETEYLVDAFNHLQNILVDDVVFDVMDSRENDMVKKFFAEWVSERPSGDPVLDAALLSRNAFAIASLKRRGLFEKGGEMFFKNKGFVIALGQQSEQEFDWVEGFLETAKADWNKEQFREKLTEYFERMLSLMRSSARLDDLR